MTAHWLHLDINSYFASLAQQVEPQLRGKPLGIVKDKGRTCLIGVSKEAKKLGIKTGANLREAQKLVPDLQVRAADFDLVLISTQRLHRLLVNLAETVDLFSLDEAFVDLRTVPRSTNKEELIRALPNMVKRELGEWITCNIGVAPSRVLAKLAGEIAPKDSISYVDDQNAINWLSRAELQDVCGIGPRLAKRLERRGLTSPYQINFLTDDELQSLVGPAWAVELRRIGLGQDPSFLIRHSQQQEQKTVGRSITGFHTTNSWSALLRIIMNLAHEVIMKVRTMKQVGFHPWLSLYGSDGERWHWHRPVKIPIAHVSELFAYFKEAAVVWQQRPFPVIRIAIGLGALRSQEWGETCWLPSWQKMERVARAQAALNHKFGSLTVRSARLAGTGLIEPEVTGFLGDRSYQFLAWGS